MKLYQIVLPASGIIFGCAAFIAFYDATAFCHLPTNILVLCIFAFPATILLIYGLKFAESGI